MSTLTIVENAANAAPTIPLPAADWNLVSLIENAKAYLGVAGGGLVTLIGLLIVIWAVVLIAKKFLGGQSSQGESWVKIALMIIIGGAILSGGLVLITDIASGGKTTIEELGGGFIVLHAFTGPVF